MGFTGPLPASRALERRLAETGIPLGLTGVAFVLSGFFVGGHLTGIMIADLRPNEQE